ncbi:hypothetical protein GGI21_002116 [Coemansia aciculifera]|uniref:Uncharacterized protein n=1 Tax=Coemansia aciculifera TaxID=417176 RepID=A0ACC1M4D2_9FUNG|nr:hypothetical protein IWW38_002319 [Coemansia aciculifera]KAJ2909205.1 hypothetical protein GGI21_002116 [Coemansia aciculifera]
MAAQALNFIRFILRPVAIYSSIQSDFGCRMLLFLNNATTILPVNLCIYCVIYLQLVVFHKVSPTKRWPRVLLLTVGVFISVVPISLYLFIHGRAIDLDSFCHLKQIPTRKQYIFIISVLAVWEYLAGAIGIISILTLIYFIARTRRETKRALHASAQYYGPSDAIGRNTHPELLHQTLMSIIWFPITPIISLWLNILLLTVNYYKNRIYVWLEFVNVVLLALQSFFLAAALIINPSVRYAHAEHRRQKRIEKSKHEVTGTHIDAAAEHPLPRLHTMDSLSPDFLNSPAFL